ncbi:MAG: hypothetical protein AVDCRST_MAG64-2682, partial [uncultured Phycisphaerae bacterium]
RPPARRRGDGECGARGDERPAVPARALPGATAGAFPVLPPLRAQRRPGGRAGDARCDRGKPGPAEDVRRVTGGGRDRANPSVTPARRLRFRDFFSKDRRENASDGAAGLEVGAGANVTDRCAGAVRDATPSRRAPDRVVRVAGQFDIVVQGPACCSRRRLKAAAQTGSLKPSRPRPCRPARSRYNRRRDAGDDGGAHERPGWSGASLPRVAGRTGHGGPPAAARGR